MEWIESMNDANKENKRQYTSGIFFDARFPQNRFVIQRLWRPRANVTVKLSIECISFSKATVCAIFHGSMQNISKMRAVNEYIFFKWLASTHSLAVRSSAVQVQPQSPGLGSLKSVCGSIERVFLSFLGIQFEIKDDEYSHFSHRHQKMYEPVFIAAEMISPQITILYSTSTIFTFTSRFSLATNVLHLYHLFQNEHTNELASE